VCRRPACDPGTIGREALDDSGLWYLPKLYAKRLYPKLSDQARVMRETVLPLNSSYLENQRARWIYEPESVSGASDLVVFG